MRVSIPGVPGVYYDTDSGSTAIGVATTALGRKAPKPKGYAIQLLPYLWSFDVDLREVPNDHPLQYLHPEGAQSIGELSPERGVREVGTELESVLRFVWSINQELESTTNQLIGRRATDDGAVIEIQEGRVSVDGDELETDEFDINEPTVGETNASTTIDIAEGESVVDDGAGSDSEGESDDGDADADDVFGATEEAPNDEFDGDEFGSDNADDIDPDEP